MIRKSLGLMLLPAALYLNAQDITLIKNTAELYAHTPQSGTAKYNAMAGAMGALGGDISTLNSNPAGLGVAITSDANVSLHFHHNKNNSSINNSQFDYSTNSTHMGQAGGILAFPLSENSDWKFFNVGMNYQSQSIENYVQTPANGTIFTDSNTGDKLINRGHAYDRTGHFSKINIGLGSNYKNKIYIGASLNFSRLDVEQYDTQRFLLTSDNRVYDLNANYSPYAEEGSGFSLSVGAIARIGQQVRLGASIETPTWWSIERNYVENTLRGSNIITSRYNEDRTLSSPMKMTLSGAFVPNKSLAINIDYTLGLTKPSYKVQGEAESVLNEFFNQHYKNVSEIRAGAEYRYKQLRLRGGYSYASNPFSNNALIGNKHTIAAGIGYDFKSFYIDAAYQNITANYNNYYGAGNYFGNTFYLASDEVKSQVKNTKNMFSISAGWKF